MLLREQMPFFLVTHRSLVEADDVEHAARKAIAKIESGGRFEVEVKSDVATIATVVIDRDRTETTSATGKSAPGPEATPDPDVPAAKPGQAAIEKAVRANIPQRPDRRTAAIVQVFLAGLTLASLCLALL